MAESGDLSHTAVEVAELVRRYGEREALRSVDVALPQGQTLVVFGPNGAGKTTLLRVLATLLLPHEGSVRVLDHELPRSAHLVRAKIGFLGHEPLLYRELSGRENLVFYARLYGIEDPNKRISEVLEATALTARADEPLHNLSRGMVQRIAICRAVLHEPELLLLDEPLANLDPGAAAAVEPLIGRPAGVARVLISHDIEQGLAEADVVLGLRGGRPAVLAPAEQLDVATLRGLYA